MGMMVMMMVMGGEFAVMSTTMMAMMTANSGDQSKWNTAGV
jgi:hypothetical protein